MCNFCQKQFCRKQSFESWQFSRRGRGPDGENLVNSPWTTCWHGPCRLKLDPDSDALTKNYQLFTAAWPSVDPCNPGESGQGIVGGAPATNPRLGKSELAHFWHRAWFEGKGWLGKLKLWTLSKPVWSTTPYWVVNFVFSGKMSPIHEKFTNKSQVWLFR